MATPTCRIWLGGKRHFAMAFSTPFAVKNLFHLYIVATFNLLEWLRMAAITIYLIRVHTMREYHISHKDYFNLHKDKIIQIPFIVFLRATIQRPARMDQSIR